MNLVKIDEASKYRKKFVFFTDASETGIYLPWTAKAESVLSLLKDVNGVADWSIVTVDGGNYFYFKSDTLWVGDMNTVIQNELSHDNEMVFDFYQSRLISNFKSIVNTVNKISDLGVLIADYQFIFNSKASGEIQLFNFEDAEYNLPVKEALDKNLVRLSDFLKAFSIYAYSDVLAQGVRFLNLLNEFNNNRIALDSSDLKISSSDREILKTLMRFSDRDDLENFHHVYFSINQRHIMLTGTQTHIPIKVGDDGARLMSFLFTKLPLSEKEIKVWELTPIIEMSDDLERFLSKSVER